MTFDKCLDIGYHFSMPSKRALSLLPLLLLCLCASGTLRALPEEDVEYRYRRTAEDGSTRVQTKSVVHRAEGDILVRHNIVDDEAFMEFIINDDGVFWQHMIWDKGWAKISKDGLVAEIDGESKDKPIERHYQLDDLQLDELPWYPDFGLLGDFALSDEPERRFYVLLPIGPRSVKIVARREQRETIVIDGREIETIRVRIKPEGILGLFWNEPFWFRASDGAVVRYETRDGRSGSKVMVELIETL